MGRNLAGRAALFTGSYRLRPGAIIGDGDRKS